MRNAEVLAQIESLKAEQAAIDARGYALVAQLVCECCGGQDEIGIRRIMYDGPICRHCFTVWHECGLQDSEAIRAESLKVQGRTSTVTGDA